ncbi:MAG TPA: RNB domain-containing ribonuclease [Planctomycetota bacterium]
MTRPTRDVLRDIARRALLQRGFLPDFSDAARADARAAAPPPPDPAVRDLRALPWCSIDNDDSRDLDQLSVSTDADTILVAIADVDVLVPQGSAADRHAAVNTTSVYTPAQVYPMLPERYSTDLTSLNEGEDRYAMVVEMKVGADGRVERSEIYRAQVRNHAKLAYNAVGAWLEGSAPPPPTVAASAVLQEQLRTQDAVSERLGGARQRLGALHLKTVEAKAVFTGDLLTDLRAEDKNRAKELIENFMIAANGVTAAFLTARGFPSIRRILRAPERWDRIVELARSMGDGLPGAPSAPELEAFLLRRRAADPLRFPDLSLSVVKLLGSGEYAVEFPGKPLEGHFGLAVRDYAHSTAPNRRYPDLVTQRLLKAAVDRRPVPLTGPELEALAAHCTEQEDDATKVERQVRKSAAALLLEGRLGETFDALVTGASEKGTWVRVLQPPVEGRVSRDQAGLDVGDRVRVKLLSTDVERGYIDFQRLR